MCLIFFEREFFETAIKHTSVAVLVALPVALSCVVKVVVTMERFFGRRNFGEILNQRHGASHRGVWPKLTNGRGANVAPLLYTIASEIWSASVYTLSRTCGLKYVQK